MTDVQKTLSAALPAAAPLKMTDARKAKLVLDWLNQNCDKVSIYAGKGQGKERIPPLKFTLALPRPAGAGCGIAVVVDYEDIPF